MPFEKGRKEGLIFQSHPIFRCFFPLGFREDLHPLFLHHTPSLVEKKWEAGGRLNLKGPIIKSNNLHKLQRVFSATFVGVWEKIAKNYVNCMPGTATSKMTFYPPRNP